MPKSIPIRYRELLRREIFANAPQIEPGEDKKNIAALKERFGDSGRGWVEYSYHFRRADGLSIQLNDGSNGIALTWTQLLREMELWQRERQGKFDIHIISVEDALYILEHDVGSYCPMGLYLIEPALGGKYVAIDNTTGEAWTEEFDNPTAAEKWLRGEDICNSAF